MEIDPNKRYSLEEFLDFIEEPNGSRVRRFHEDHRGLIDVAKGSKTKHQAWKGGYRDHLEEGLNIAALNYWVEEKYFREHPFSFSDVVLTFYFHDLEKVAKYSGNEDLFKEFEGFENYQDFIFSKAREYGVEFSDDHVNAIKYVHGENEDYHPTINVMGPLAAFIHGCDYKSARIWPNHPKQDK